MEATHTPNVSLKKYINIEYSVFFFYLIECTDLIIVQTFPEKGKQNKVKGSFWFPYSDNLFKQLNILKFPFFLIGRLTLFFTKKWLPNAFCNVFQLVSERHYYNIRNSCKFCYCHAELMSHNFQRTLADPNSSILFLMTLETLTVGIE